MTISARISPEILFSMFAACFTLAFYASQSYADIYKCKDPNTGRLNFTDKPCAAEEETTHINGKSGTSKKPSPLLEYTASALQAHLVKRERELVHASNLMHFDRNRKTQRERHRLKKERDAWRLHRLTTCAKEHRYREENSEEHKAHLICHIQITEERLANFVSHSDDGDVKSLINSVKRVTLKTGKAGLVDGVQRGYLQMANAGVMQRYLDAAGLEKPTSGILRFQSKYLIKQPIRLSGGLGGGNAAIFFINNGSLFPSGDIGHSTVLNLSTGACGGFCHMFEEQRGSQGQR